jgi:hypothetical protein
MNTLAPTPNPTRNTTTARGALDGPDIPVQMDSHYLLYRIIVLENLSGTVTETCVRPRVYIFVSVCMLYLLYNYHIFMNVKLRFYIHVKSNLDTVNY